jgi:hypothetical protein
MHLLENQRPQGGKDLLGRSPESVGITRRDLMNGQLGKDMIPEQTGPGFVQKFASFGAQVVPGIDQVGRFVITGMN